LHSRQLDQHVRLQRCECRGELALWVENFWELRWSMPPERHYPSQVLPHPTVSLTIEFGHTRPEIANESVVVTGVSTRRFDVDIHGQGQVFGIKFRPGGFVAMFDTPANTLRNRGVSASGVVSPQIYRVLAHLEPTMALAQWTTQIQQAFLGDLPTPDANYQFLLEIITLMLTDRSLLRVDQVERKLGVSKRRLQRLFAHYVGVGPKWVLMRYRLHDVVTTLDDGYEGSLTDLATTYGWYDQAHFIRDFSALIGTTPSAYRDTVRMPEG
jgi:AraC-like DNA-binding protein